MRARAKTGGNTQERIMEIVGFLLKKIIESPEEARCQGELVRGLEEQGYRRAEIDAAIELVLAVPEIISSTADPVAGHHVNLTTRVFSGIETQKLGLTVRGRLLQYRALGLLTELEWEQVMMHLLLTDSREVGLADLHLAMRKVIEDEERLMLLLPNPRLPLSATIN